MHHDGVIDVTPIFLLSMPRSGSTMLQRILAVHPEIATGPEPTFLLPLFRLRDRQAVAATYDQRYTAMAIEDFFASVGNDAFDRAVHDWASSTFRRAVPGGERYFLDKTPKYHQIGADLARVFPEAPVIVLWRNPLAVISSILETWGGGRWNLQHFRLDLFDGLPQLVDLVQEHPGRVHVVRYEDLVADPATEIERLSSHLDLSFDAAALERFVDIELVGRVQDRNVGSPGFRTVRDDRVDRWREMLGNPIRRRWCRRYLRWLGAERLGVMGYDLDELVAEIDGLSPTTRHLAGDLVRVPYDTLYRLFEVEMLARRVADLGQGRRPLLAHK